MASSATHVIVSTAVLDVHWRVHGKWFVCFYNIAKCNTFFVVAVVVLPPPNRQKRPRHPLNIGFANLTTTRYGKITNVHALGGSVNPYAQKGALTDHSKKKFKKKFLTFTLLYTPQHDHLLSYRTI